MPVVHERAHHDMGGLPAGPVEPVEHQPCPWEKRVDALLVCWGLERQLMRTDELRRNIEALAPDVYESLTYYERWMARSRRPCSSAASSPPTSWAASWPRWKLASMIPTPRRPPASRPATGCGSAMPIRPAMSGRRTTSAGGAAGSSVCAAPSPIRRNSPITGRACRASRSIACASGERGVARLPRAGGRHGRRRDLSALAGAGVSARDQDHGEGHRTTCEHAPHPPRPDPRRTPAGHRAMEIAVRELLIDKGIFTADAIRSRSRKWITAARRRRARSGPGLDRSRIQGAAATGRRRGMRLVGFDRPLQAGRRREHARLCTIIVVCTLCSCYPRPAARPAAGLVQEPRLSLPRGARAARRAVPSSARRSPTRSRCASTIRPRTCAISCCPSGRPAPTAGARRGWPAGHPRQHDRRRGAGPRDGGIGAGPAWDVRLGGPTGGLSASGPGHPGRSAHDGRLRRPGANQRRTEQSPLRMRG